MSATSSRSTREHVRAAVTLEVQYRSVSSFLVSYSANLSQGGLFLATSELHPVGSPLRVRFTIPGSTAPGGTIETDAVVAWVRQAPAADGLPAGMGLAFDRLDEQIGAQIDAAVREFAGVTLMAVAASASAVERLARQLCNTLTCSVLRCTSTSDALDRLGPDIDLVVVDLDSLGGSGLALLGEIAHRVPLQPLLAVGHDESLCHVARASGVPVLDSPPAQRALNLQVIDLVGRPAAR